jgi:hypothetical protein
VFAILRLPFEAVQRASGHSFVRVSLADLDCPLTQDVDGE